MNKRFALGFVLSIVTFVHVAVAQETPLYLVVTNDGSSYQGQLVENIVGQHVTIKLASGEIRSFQASEVKSQGNVAAPAPVTPPPVTPAPLPDVAALAVAAGIAPLPGAPGGPPITYGGPDAVQIHVTKDNNGESSLFMESTSGWLRVCTMPCTTAVDPKIEYKLRNSDAFRFPAGPPLDLVETGGGHRVLSAIGWTMITTSLIAAPFGLAINLGAFDAQGGTPRTPQEMAAHQALASTDTNVAIAFYTVSAALLITGIVLTSLHPSSTLSTTSGRRIVELTPRGLVF
ncbi:MAG TPA: hypothetical protein VGH28_24265 [Polyangiaceae bacterium]|jgi:hypothetical protein